MCGCPPTLHKVPKETAQKPGGREPHLPAYRTARLALRDTIRQSKAEAWQEWLNTLERDPWGRPYKWLRQQFRPAAPPLTQNIDPILRRTVVTTLFPDRADWSPPTMAPPREDSQEEEEEIPSVTSEELHAAVVKMGSKNTAPGLDGVPRRAWM